MKLTGLLQVISTYKIYASEFLSWWPKVRSISWPPHYLPISQWGNMKMLPVPYKPIETTQSFQDHGHSPHLCGFGCNRRRSKVTRSNEVTIRFSPISRDRMEIETRKWCQTTWAIEPLRRMCILTYLDHDLTLIWPWPDLRSNFEIGITRSKSIYIKPTRRDEYDGLTFIFVSPTPKKLLMKNHLRENDSFSFDDLWSQNYWPSVKSDREPLPGHEESSPMLFLFFLAITLLETIAIACEKSLFS